MQRTALTLSSLIISIVLLISGNAFLMTLLGLRLSIEEFSTALIGWILVFYSLGFVAGTLWAGRIIEKVGHIRAFAVFAAVLAASILIYPMAVEAGLWGFLRALGGFVMAGLMIVMESWFSSKATNQNRATLFAVYQLVFFLSTAGGQVLIRAGDPGGIRATIWTDAAQSLVMIGSMVMILVMSWLTIGGPSDLFDNLREQDPALMSLFPSNLEFGVLFYLLGMMAGGFGSMGQPQIMVRFMAIESVQAIKKARV
jgi:MFS family permease